MNKNEIFSIGSPTTGLSIRKHLETKFVDVYLIYNGKILQDTDKVQDGTIHVVPRLLGGKGGFGSMLRAIGAQIEKTTNREACRDLSGRRLRDINEEKRLKNWIAQQKDREEEMAERRKKRLERLCTEPKHEFEDKSYEKERADLLEKISDSVEEGLKAATSSNGAGPSSKRKTTSTVTSNVKPKKPRLWMDAEFENLSDEVSSDEDEVQAQPGSSKVAAVST